jgi:hypothetical protein
MRFLYLLAALSLTLALAGCRSAPPPPDDGGVHVRAPFVNVDVPR